ncbi:MAG TPA: tetratricopeptide repeat protein [Thermoanaerobaculia bacterium]|nr:tetratricopeptide repeat protein [Thermoanaerobaculia bacterium]
MTSRRPPLAPEDRRRASRAGSMLGGALLLAMAGVRLASATELPVDVLAVPSPDPASGHPVVAVVVEVPGAALLQGDSRGGAEGEVWAFAQDGNDRTVDTFVQPFTLPPGDPFRAPGEIGLKVLGSLRLPPGEYRLQVTVATASGRTGAAATRLTVPDFASGDAASSPPLFPDRRDRWHVVRQGLPSLVELQLHGAGEALAPRVVGEAPLDGPLVFHLITHQVSAWDSGLDARLVDADGRPTPVAARVLDRREGAVADQLLVRVALEAQPAGPGLYWLDLGVPGVARRVRAPLRFVAAPDAPLGSRAAAAAAAAAADSDDAAGWRDLPAEVVEEDPPAEGDGEPAGALAAQEMGRRYVEAVTAFAGGEQEKALAALLRLETAVAAQEPRGRLGSLRRVQRGVIDGLAAEGASLLPLIDLHSRLDPGYLARNEARLSAENRVFVVELVERWVRAEGAGEARRLGGLLLAALGAVQQALELDPSNPLALLRLGIGAERSAQLDTAATYFERLLAADPQDAHARLRLAVVLRRQGRALEARPMLAALTASTVDGRQPPPRWIAALAFQELAMLEREAGRLALAEATLQRGIAATGAQSLHLLRAYYLELQQRHAEAATALDRLPVTETAAESAPRHRYNGQPDSELSAARERIARAVSDRVDGLRAALPQPPDAPVRWR